MSLINKMLQDLDARRVQDNGAAIPIIKPMERSGRRSATTIVTSIAAVLAGGLMIAGAIAAWRFYEKREAAGAVPATPSVTFVTAKPAAPPVPAPVAQAVISPAPAQQVRSEPEPVMAGQSSASAVEPARVRLPALEAEQRQRLAGQTRLRLPVKAPSVDSQAQPQPVQGRVMSSQQRAEGNYLRATAALQEGRVREAIDLLEDALAAEPRHDAARQTLVRLLIEAKRNEEAMRVLQAGLVIDPRQPTMAMLLARLQIEHGGTGIETLMRSLPYAAGDADYEGFLAGALQRASRHREAIGQYQAAVRSAPGNGVWWMGLGISLQAEKRAPEAADAYARALGSGSLSPDLHTFVERRLDQVRR